MHITKCDICKKTIKNNAEVVAGTKFALSRYVFCFACGKPILDFLKKHKFVNEKGEHLDT